MDKNTTRIKRNKIIQLPLPRYEAISIAKYLFSLDPKRNYFNDKRRISTGTGFSSVLIGNWRLNQILYLLQIFHYVKYGKFLFKDDLYAFDNGFVIYDAYRNFWTLYNGQYFDNGVKDIHDKETKQFIKQYFNYFKNYTIKGLEEWYTTDPAWIEAWLERKKEPKIDFDQKTLTYYQNFLPSHLHYIEQVS